MAAAGFDEDLTSGNITSGRTVRDDTTLPLKGDLAFTEPRVCCRCEQRAPEARGDMQCGEVGATAYIMAKTLTKPIIEK